MLEMLHFQERNYLDSGGLNLGTYAINATQSTHLNLDAKQQIYNI